MPTVICGSTGTTSLSFAARTFGGIADCGAAATVTAAAIAAISKVRRTRAARIFIRSVFGRSALLGGLQILLGCRLVPKGRRLIRIDANHQIVNVVVNFLEPVAGARRNDDDVADLQVIRLPVAER